MGILREVPPTAGFPIYLRDLLGLFSNKNRPTSLEGWLKEYLCVYFLKLAPSGTAAFYIILEAAKELSSKKTVVIPAFSCPLLALAIRRSGLKVKTCDINASGFEFDKKALAKICAEDPDILAVVAVHLAGIPLDLEQLTEITRRNSILLIEDCAQSLGAEYRNKKVGTVGDFSFFSLARGKGLTIYEGGLAATNKKEYAALLDKEFLRILKTDFPVESLRILELFGYALIYRPGLFWFGYSLPRHFWNLLNQPIRAEAEYFALNFPLNRVGRIRNAIGCLQLERLEQEIDRQRENAKSYICRLEKTNGIYLITEQRGCRGTYPYLTIIFADRSKREKARKALACHGVGVSQIYAEALPDYGYLKDIVDNSDCPNARMMSKNTLTLPTGIFVKQNDFEKIIEVLRGL